MCFGLCWVGGGRIFSRRRVIPDVLVRQREQAQCIALFLTGLPAANMIGAPLSGWILDQRSLDALAKLAMAAGGRRRARNYFGIVTYFILPSRPSEAGFLTRRKKIGASRTGTRATSEAKAKPIGTLQALTIFRVWHAGLIVLRPTAACTC